MTHLQPSLTREAASKLRIARITISIIATVAAFVVVTVVALAPTPVHMHKGRVFTYIAGPTLEAADLPCIAETPAEVATATSLPLAALHKPWLGVAVSPSQRTMALWTASEIFVSTDGGLRVEPIAMDGTILAASTDALGRVWVLSSTQEGTQLRAIVNTKLVTDVSVPMNVVGKVETFTASASAVALVAFIADGPDSEDETNEPQMQVFSPAGNTWVTQDLPSWGNAGNSVVVAHDGSIDMMGGSEASCGGGYQYHYRSTISAAEWQEVAWPIDAPFGFVIGAEGWSYALDNSCIEKQGDTYLYTLCATDPEGKLQRVDGAAVSDQLGDSFLTASNGQAHIATIDGKLVSLHGKILKTLATLPAPALALAVDDQGDAIILSNDKLWRWSSRGGWQALASRLAVTE